MKGIGDMDTLTLKRERFKAGSLTIEARKNGPSVWAFRWQDGRKRRKQILGSTKDLNRTQALKMCGEYRERSNAPQQLRGTDLTVSELFKHYQERELGDDSGKALKPRKAYLYIFNNYLLPRWGDFPLQNVKAIAVEDWLKTLPLANGSKAKVREVFGAAFRHAMRHEMYALNPIASVRQIRKRAIEPEILEVSEIVAVLHELKDTLLVWTAFLIAAVMGMRRGEIFGLRWHDIDVERSILHVRRSYVDGVEGPPKTDSSRRPMPISLPVLEALQVWRKATTYSATTDWVFASAFHFGKQPVWPGTLWRRNVAPAIERAGITKPKLGWHSLRRSYASLLLSSGASLRVSMELMRHSTPDMTLATYAQSMGNEKRDAGSRVALLVLESGKAA